MKAKHLIQLLSTVDPEIEIAVEGINDIFADFWLDEDLLLNWETRQIFSTSKEADDYFALSPVDDPTLQPVVVLSW